MDGGCVLFYKPILDVRRMQSTIDLTYRQIYPAFLLRLRTYKQMLSLRVLMHGLAA